MPRPPKRRNGRLWCKNLGFVGTSVLLSSVLSRTFRLCRNERLFILTFFSHPESLSIVQLLRRFCDPCFDLSAMRRVGCLPTHFLTPVVKWRRVILRPNVARRATLLLSCNPVTYQHDGPIEQSQSKLGSRIFSKVPRYYTVFQF
jgi:hypothetical protein